MANKKGESNIGKGIATFAIWASVGGLSFLFHSFGILSGGGRGMDGIRSIFTDSGTLEK